MHVKNGMETRDCFFVLARYALSSAEALTVNILGRFGSVH